MSHGCFSTDSISNSRAPCCFEKNTADEGKLSPSLLSQSDLNVVEPNSDLAAIEYENSIGRKKILPRQASITRRRSKDDHNKSDVYYGSSSRCLGADVSTPRLNISSYSLDEEQEFESLPPGAYDCSPTDKYKCPSTRTELEIAPGVFAALRGSQETLNAIRDGDCVNVTCSWCTAKLLCVSDTAYVLCPDCRVVSPLDSPGKCDLGGVGLGLRAPSKPAEMEIAPGVFAVLRGSQETQNAIRDGDCVNMTCSWCAAKLLCISDAEYVVCPDCRVVSPLDLPGTRDVGGVGLGLRVE
jgi:hypothetical protein